MKFISCIIIIVLIRVERTDSFLKLMSSKGTVPERYLNTFDKRQSGLQALSSDDETKIPMMGKDDLALYATVSLFQLLPPLAIVDLPDNIDFIRKPVCYLYFIVTACLAVYLGSKSQTFGAETSVISKKRALLAPFVSSAFLVGLYFILKYTDIDKFFGEGYQILATLFGLICVDSVVSTLLNNVSNSIRNPTQQISTVAYDGSPLSTDFGLIIGAITSLSYITLSNFGGSTALSLCGVSFFNNILSVSIALQAIGTIKIESFAVACSFLIGLFFYDIIWVFGTDVMMTVATKVEAPVKLLFPADPEHMFQRSYPFSVLGLGDLVVPGIMCAFARRLDLYGLDPNGIESKKMFDKLHASFLFLKSFFTFCFDCR